MLTATNLSFAYNAGKPDAILALSGVSFSLQPGEMVAILGQNGSGKSTLARLLCAMLTPTGGSFSVDGVPAVEEQVWEIRRRVGMVFQRPDDQLVANTVIDDVAFGPENLGLPRSEIERRVHACLDSLGLTAIGHKQISELSGGEKQRVAIAGVMAMEPSYLILDEPTTMLPPPMARQVLRLAHELRARQGVAVIHITHFMHEAVDFDRLIVLDAGRIIMDGPPRAIFARADELQACGLTVPGATRLAQALRSRGIDLPPAVLTAEELAGLLEDRGTRTGASRCAPTGDKGTDTGGRVQGQAGAGGRVQRATPAPPALSPQPAARTQQPIIEVQDLRFTYMAGTPLALEALRGVSCAVYPGETLAILGGTQAGKSTLIEFFAGLRRPAAGTIRAAGREPDAPGEGPPLAVSIVFQQPETQLIEETVGKDVSYVPRKRGLPPAESRALVEQALQAVGLDYEAFRLRYVYALSGGQKRRVAIAGALAAQPQVLILDEPVAGLDPRGRAELAALIAELSRRLDLTVVLVGNTIDDLALLADRALVLHEGRVALEGSIRDLLRRADELHAMGLALSEAAEAALALRRVFPDLPTDLAHLDELADALIDRLM